MTLKNILSTGLITLLLALLNGGCSKPALTSVAAPADIQQRINTSKARVTLVHTWATWCDPCREELPELLAACRPFSSKELNLLLISADEPAEQPMVETFLSEHAHSTPSLIASELSTTFIETLSPTWGGALPASFFFVDGKRVEEWEGKRSKEAYVETINKLLNPTEEATP